MSFMLKVELMLKRKLGPDYSFNHKCQQAERELTRIATF